MRTTVDIDVDKLDRLTQATGLSRSAVLDAGMKAIAERVASNQLADLLERGVATTVTVAKRRRF